jgi:hypothetical protein
MLGVEKEIEVKNFDFAIAVLQDLQRSLEEKLIAMIFAHVKNKSMEHPIDHLMNHPINIKNPKDPVIHNLLALNSMIHKLFAFEAMDAMTYIASEPMLVEITIGDRTVNERMFESLVELYRPVELAKYLKI